MRELLDGASGERLAIDLYRKEFAKKFQRVGSPGFWKLERLQTFQEASDKSWDAFVEGDWGRALRLLEAQRSSFTEFYQKSERDGFRISRVRVVEHPITPYLQWELYLFRLRSQCGESIRVIDAGQVEGFEKNGILPELVTLGTEVMYEIVYDENGRVQGAVRFRDRELIVRCQEVIQDFHSAGEDVESFFEREVAGLGSPRGGMADADRRAG
jgi:hypothetical protein